MGFEVQPTAIRAGRWRAGILAVAMITIGVVSIGIWFPKPSHPAANPEPSIATPAAASATGPTAVGRSAAKPSVAATAAASARPRSTTAAPPSAATQVGASRTLVQRLECNGVAYQTCSRIVYAAAGALPEGLPPVVKASIWATIMCSSTLECPSTLLTADADPLGSAVLTFADGGPAAWINVVSLMSADGGAPTSRAWLVRWE